MQYSHTEGENTTTGYFVYNGIITYVDSTHTQDIIQLSGDFTNNFPVNSYLVYSYGTSNNDFPYLTSVQGINYDNVNTYKTASLNTLNSSIAIFIANIDDLSSGTYEMGGKGSHAEGISTRAAGIDAHAEGNAAVALGWYSHAEGDNTRTGNVSSHAEGISARAYGAYSHAEGNSTLARGYASHTEGVSTITGKNATYAHAEGDETQVTGYGSHAEGKSTLASGQWAHAEGYNTTASGQYSHAGGQFTVASGIGQTVVGKYNTLNNTTDLFVVGNGTPNTRFNAFTVSSTNIKANIPFIAMNSAINPTSGVQLGAIYFNTITNQFLGWNGTTWVVLG
jgi:hypothetical protein